MSEYVPDKYINVQCKEDYYVAAEKAEYLLVQKIVVHITSCQQTKISSGVSSFYDEFDSDTFFSENLRAKFGCKKVL